MIHELADQSSFSYRPNLVIYTILIFFLFFYFLFFGQLTDLLANNSASQFGKHFFSSTSNTYLTFIVVLVTFCRQLASQLTQHKKHQRTQSQQPARKQAGWDGKFLYCTALIVYALGSRRKELRSIPFVQSNVDSILNWAKQNKKNKRDCEGIAMWPLHFCSSNSNIYFYQITFSLSNLLSAG